MDLRGNDQASHREGEQARLGFFVRDPVCEEAIGKSHREVQCLKFVAFGVVERFNHEYELLACVIDHIVGWVIFNIISDRHVLLEHRVVGALRVLGCELPDSGIFRRCLLRDIEEVDCWYVLLDDMDPSLDHDQSGVLLRSNSGRSCLVRATGGRIGEFIGRSVLLGHALDAVGSVAMLCCDE